MSTPTILGSVNLSAATPADVFASPATGAVFNVRIVNNNAAAAAVKLGLSTTTATLESDTRLIGDGTSIQSGGFLELTGLVIESGFFLVAESDVVTVNVVAYGMEF